MIAGICNPSAGLIVERQPFFLKPKAAKFADEALPYLAKHPAEDRYRLPPLEQRFTVVDRRPDLIPCVLYQKSLLSHINIYMGRTRRFASIEQEKSDKEQKKA
jgi:hypothetical protein